MQYIFGKDISRVFYPTENDVPLSLPSQTPTIYVFDRKPSLTEAAAGTGAIKTISTWSQDTSSPYGCTYTITAIDDPQPTSLTDYKEYWEALNFYAKVGADVAPVIRKITLSRILGQDSQPGTSITDLKNIYPAISAYLSDAQLTQFLTIALDEIKLTLKAKGLDWAKLHELYELKLALAYKAITLCSLSQIREPEDRFAVRWKTFSDMYESLITNIKLSYDSDGDGEAEAPVEAKRGYWIAAR